MQAKSSLYADEKGLFFGKWWLFVDKYRGFLQPRGAKRHDESMQSRARAQQNHEKH